MKKLIAMLLVLAMAVSCFVGCVKTPADDTKGTNPPAADTKDTTTTETTEPVVENRFDGKHEIVELTWCVRNNAQLTDLDNVLAHLNKILEERYNLRLKIEVYANKEYNDKMTLKMTGNEPWDICYTANFVNKYNERVAMGAFYDLNELMDSPVWAELMEVYPEGLYNWAILDGHLYGLPNYQIMSSPTALFVQKELADKYALPYKEGDTVKDLFDAELVKFFDNIRDKEKDYYPIQLNDMGRLAIWSNGEGYGCEVYGNVAYTFMDGTDYTVFNGYTDKDESERAITKMVKQLEFFNAGYFRPDALTVTDDTTDMANNRYASFCGVGKPGGGADMSNRQGKDYIMIYLNNGEYYETSPMTTCTAINYACKDPEAALKMIQVMWSDKEVYNTFLAGIEGTHYKKVAENRIELIADSGYNLTGWGWGCGNQFNQWLLPGQDDDVWEQTKKMNEDAKQSKMSGFVFDSTNVEVELGNIATVMAEYKNFQLRCKDEAEIRAEYAKMVEALQAGGADTVVKEAQAQVDAWAAANGKK